jgi:hypothetical protein
MKMTITRFALLAAAILLLGACKDAGTGKTIIKEKGVYSGQVDEQLTEAQREELRHRMSIQRGGNL